MQAPPNLSDSTELGLLLRAGVDDWGGVSPLTPDHVNPERPWPNIDKLAALSAEAGFALRERLAAQPPYVLAARAVAGPAGAPARVRAGRRRTGWPSRTASRSGCRGRSRTRRGRRPGRVDLHVEVDTVGPHGGPAQRLRRRLRRLGGAARADDGRAATGTRPRWRPATARCSAALLHAEQDPAGLSDAEYLALLGADGTDLEHLCALADAVRARRQRRRRHLRREPEHQLHQRLLHRLPVLRVRPAAHRRRRLHAVDGRRSATGSTRRGRPGATEICMQGGIHPDLPGTAYFDLAREVKKRQPGIHLHAFSPDGDRQRRGPHRAVVRRLPDRGARRPGSTPCPGTAAEILDDDVRWVLTKGKLPTATWLEIITHRAPRGPADDVDDDVRPRRHPGALGRAPAHAGRAAGRDRRLHRVRAAAVRAPQLADLPGRRRPARARRCGRTGRCTRSPGCCCTAGSPTSRRRG